MKILIIGGTGTISSYVVKKCLEVGMDAAIYGFVIEISTVKEYWFDYDEENWDPVFWRLC